MESNAEQKYQEWMNSPYFDEASKEELRSLAGKDAELEDRFYKDLRFGTGGMRGLMGAGTNRLNIYTVRKATQGLADYIRSTGKQDQGVVLVYDSRHNSPEMAEAAALCLNANGIRTWMFDSLRPTPELSFAIRKLHAVAGIAITASHNPAEYNGFKVYWEDGGQITPPHDKNIMQYAAQVPLTGIPHMEKADAVAEGLFQMLGDEMDRQYLEAVRSVLLNPETLKTYAKEIRIVYTPLHGAGNVPVQQLLKSMGFTNLFVVKEQEEPDGDFTTCRKPNPEEEEAWEKALALAEQVDADLVMATDPDSDRIGMYVKDRKTGRYLSFTGNMIGILLMNYVLSEQEKRGLLPENGVVMKTIVSSRMAEPIACRYHCQLQEVLTGFKYIGEAMHQFEQTGDRTFVFGFEESLGILSGDYVRDKDAQCAVALIADAAAYYQSRGMSLADAMEELYECYGYNLEGLMVAVHTGKAGNQYILDLMKRMRASAPDQIGGQTVTAVRDYQTGIRTDRSGCETPMDLPESNVLYYELENGWCCIRPSGTEPKIKVYYGVAGKTADEAERLLEELHQGLKQLTA